MPAAARGPVGPQQFSLQHPKARMGLYRTALAEGQRADLVASLNRDLRVAQWPVLRRQVSRHLREGWEKAFPEFAASSEQS
ncbi:hypothetical protein [Streptomyces sp. NPDC047070]|uniref:hypothetical protein n=1 Tax=Streptomyces sp. NPDC047070 TaxID=3154923 RepID=UPI003455B722